MKLPSGYKTIAQWAEDNKIPERTVRYWVEHGKIAHQKKRTYVVILHKDAKPQGTYNVKRKKQK